METNVSRILEIKKITPTAMRVLVLKILVQKQRAVSLLEIQQQFEQVDRSTIFRTLKTFEKHCIIHKVDDGTGATKFALCSDNCSCALGDLHAHFYCTRCTQTTCLKDHLIEKPVLPEHFMFESASFVIKGICAACR